MQQLSVVDVIRDEGVSASRSLRSRPGGERLLTALRGREAEHVVAFKLDRLFRNALDALQQIEAWDKSGVALHLLDMGGTSLNTGTAMGRMFLTMTAAFAELERNLISERTRLALETKRSRHEAYSPTPFGFERVDDGLVANDDEQRVLAQMRKWRAEGSSLRTIVGELQRQGVATKRGGQWHAATVRYMLLNETHEN
jgi:DNA invertase Pin-like site-specific DNA recombinase